MRLITWNCRVGGFRWKARHISTFKPDVLAVQEVEPYVRLKFAADYRPQYVDHSCVEAFPRRGFGMFSYTDTTITAIDGTECFSGFRRYEVRRDGLTFNVVGVWPWATRTRKTSYRQAHDGLSRNAEWIKSRPTVLLGDFNASKSYGDRNWSELLDLIAPFGLVSAYHEVNNERFGEETVGTHFHHGKSEPLFHLDYCFVPTDWLPRVTSAEVGRFERWGAISDHAPLIVDLRL
jgi:endonuclease/exonuclease/phosphatase family metal-dependent hydrolase